MGNFGRVLWFFLMIAFLVALGADFPGLNASDGQPRERGPAGMSLGQAVVLGLVEGITEYLPVSSTGHLLLAERLMGIGVDSSANGPDAERARNAADAYAICIQAGAIIAVVGLYFRRVRQVFLGIIGKDAAGLRLGVNIVGAFLPAAVIGFLFSSLIKQHLFGLWPVVFAWFVGGIAIIAAARWQNRRQGKRCTGRALDELTLKMALVIGFAQCIAMWPGVSRSLITIVGGVLTGLTLAASVEFSFLLGVVTLGAATAYDALKHGRDMLLTFDLTSLWVGLLSAFLSAVVSVKWMVAYLNRHGMAVFGYYRVALAVVVAALIALGIVKG